MITISKDEMKMLHDGDNGNYGTCYMYKDNVLKVFTKDSTYYYNKRSIKRNIKRSVGLKVEDVAFPIDIAKVKGYNFSYVMPYISGYNLDEFINKIIYTDFDMTFDDFIHLYDDAIRKSEKIASLGIEMNDLHKDNCRFKADFTIGIFDVDFYERKLFVNDLIRKSLIYYNMLSVNDTFYDILKYIYNKKINYSGTNKDVYELQKLKKIISNSPRNKKEYIDSALTNINDELKISSVKKLIIG